MLTQERSGVYTTLFFWALKHISIFLGAKTYFCSRISLIINYYT